MADVPLKGRAGRRLFEKSRTKRSWEICYVRNMADKNRMPRRQNNGLLKEVFEENFADFLWFVIPGADREYDLSWGFEFLDKELRAIVPARRRARGRSVGQGLFEEREGNVFCVNTEIGGSSNTEFPLRMYECNYRTRDEFHRTLVVSIAFYTGGSKQPRPSEFRIEAGGWPFSGFWPTTCSTIPKSNCLPWASPLHRFSQPAKIPIWKASCPKGNRALHVLEPVYDLEMRVF